MAYVEVGSGDHTVLFVHGNPTSKYMWRNVMSRCETLGRVVAPDLIGMGESAKVEGGEHDRYDLKEHCRYFAAFMEEVGGEGDVTLVGHSWGGTIAAHWGSFNPGRVRGLVCLEGLFTSRFLVGRMCRRRSGGA
jgi:haloalkane dehalogenase